MAGNDLNDNINDTNVNGVDNLLPHWNKLKADVWEFWALNLMGREM